VNNPSVLDFVGVGPQKTATSWLYSSLSGAPGLAFPTVVKETFFWDRRFDQGLAWYVRLFGVVAAGHLRGEMGPTYFDSLAAIERIKSHAPECRIIITVRDPNARLYSLYLHERRKGRSGNSFIEALRANPDLAEGSRYGIWIPRWQAAFGVERVYVVLMDDVIAKPREVIAGVWAFLGLPADRVPEPRDERVNAASLPRFPRLATALTWVAATLRRCNLYGVVEFGKRLGLKRVYGGADLPADGEQKARAALGSRFDEDVVFIERLTGRDLTHWKSGSRDPRI